MKSKEEVNYYSKQILENLNEKYSNINNTENHIILKWLFDDFIYLWKNNIEKMFDKNYKKYRKLWLWFLKLELEIFNKNLKESILEIDALLFLSKKEMNNILTKKFSTWSWYNMISKWKNNTIVIDNKLLVSKKIFQDWKLLNINF